MKTELTTKYAEGLVKELVDTASNTVDQLIEYAVKQKVNSLDIKALIYESIEKILLRHLDTIVFPAKSIPHTAINFQDIKLSGENIQGGIHKDFGSTGIDDQATGCRLTVLDDFVVVENTLLSDSLSVKKDLTVEGTLHIKGEVATDSKGYVKLVNDIIETSKKDIVQSLASELSGSTISQIKQHGLEVSKLTIDGKTLINHNSLSPTIIESNLQKLGVLQSLDVKGTAKFTDTLYVSNNRVGVNTESPSSALAVWDEECETVLGKFEKNTGFIGSVRNQPVVIGSGHNKNMTLTPEGDVEIAKLKIGAHKIEISTSATLPNRTGSKGELVFNSDPQIGKPIGWVCVGENRWALLPTIQ